MVFLKKNLNNKSVFLSNAAAFYWNENMDEQIFWLWLDE